jgi:hypothetical protein
MNEHDDYARRTKPKYWDMVASQEVSVAVRKGARMAAQVGPRVRLPSERDTFEGNLERRLGVNIPQEDAFTPLRLRLAR